MTSINTNLYNVAFNQFIKLFISSTTNVTQLKTHNKRVPIQITMFTFTRYSITNKKLFKIFFSKKSLYVRNMYLICFIYIYIYILVIKGDTLKWVQHIHTDFTLFQ